MSRPARVLYVQKPLGGGTATALLDLLKFLDRGRVEPIVLMPEGGRYGPRFEALGASWIRWPEESSAAGLPAAVSDAGSRLKKRFQGVRQWNRLIRRDWPEARRLARLIQDASVDLVHHNDTPSADRASIIGAALAGKPQVCHVRNLGRYSRAIDGGLSRFVGRYLYMSRAIERHSRAGAGLAPDQGEVLYDPFDFSAIESDAVAGRRLRAELGVEDATPLVVTIGRLTSWKGQDVFLRGFAGLLRSMPRGRALVVGGAGDDPESRRYAASLPELATELGIADRVVFTGHRDDVAAVLAAADVVVHTSVRPEPFGRVAVEAMAAGRPLIAAGAGGIPEIVDAGRTGSLVPPGDPEALAEALRELAARPARARAMGRRAADVVRVRFAPEPFARRLHLTYDRLLGRRSASALRTAGFHSPLAAGATE